MKKLNEFVEIYKDPSDNKFLFRGIIKGGISIVIGPSGAGKSTLCECLALHLANGKETFLDEPLIGEALKVLVISLEEDDQPNERTERLNNQANSYNLDINCEIFFNEPNDLPSYINSDEDRKALKDYIANSGAEAVFIDSTTRLCPSGIEDSTKANDFLNWIRTLRKETDTTIVLVHHPRKVDMDRILDVSTMAGSRVICQEVSSIIGMNRLSDGTLYLKDLKTRHTKSNIPVLVIERVDDSAFIPIGYTSEKKLVNNAIKGEKHDGRVNETLRHFIVHLITSSPSGIMQTKEIIEAVEANLGFKATNTKEVLSSMVKENKLTRPIKGSYELFKAFTSLGIPSSTNS